MDASTFGKVMSSEDKYLVTVTLPQSAFEADISQAEDVSPCFIAKRPCGLLTNHPCCFGVGECLPWRF